MATLPDIRDHDELVRRVNELYHDHQSRDFDALHKDRHQVEQIFWRDEVVPRLVGSHSVQGVDLCTGTGYVPQILLRSLPPEITIRCIDISPRALAEAEDRLKEFGDRVTFASADAASLPIPDASVDWVSMNAALHHMPRPEAVLDEIDRILKPGGVFCLGHEPNARFFASKGLVSIERTIWHAFWYLSPSRNARRIRKLLSKGQGQTDPESKDYLDDINASLLRERRIDRPLTLVDLRKLVDIHTHAADDESHGRGFDAPTLIGRKLAEYEKLSMIYSDYGGEMLRKHRRSRVAFDGVMRRLAPGRGRLFSWILRKPSHG